ncbi:MAG TPA: CARDB domain-containing protein [Ignavibacteria bacterium]|jgi:hypothetical protein
MKHIYFHLAFLFFLFSGLQAASANIYVQNEISLNTNPLFANDIAVGPFLRLPGIFVLGNTYSIKAKVTNVGTNNQINIPTRFSVNGTVVGTGTIASLPAAAVDSVLFNWIPPAAGNYTLRIYSALAVDEDRSNDTVSAAVVVYVPGPWPQPTICRHGINKPILDPPSLGVFDTIIVNIANALNVIDVNVIIDTVLHTWDSDLVFRLIHLSIIDSLIINRGGSGDNFIGAVLDDSAGVQFPPPPPFTGRFRPDRPLAMFNNNPVNGVWVLHIRDMVGGDTGLLKAWCLQVVYSTLLGGIQTIEIPGDYFLNQNYPNPFNPTTTIQYGIPKAGNVSLKIFDVLGRHIITLVNENKQPGVYSVSFDASNYASGLYFYKIEVSDASTSLSTNFIQTKKMLLVK